MTDAPSENESGTTAISPPPTSEERKQGIAGVFGRAASTYDQVGPRFFSHFGKRLVELAHLNSGDLVLDVAAGNGIIAFLAAENVGADGRVIAIDLSAGMIEAAKQRAAERGLTNIEFRVMDAEQLDFEDETFDVILCGFGLMFFPDQAGTLAGFYRVLRPGGMIAVSTWGRDDDRWAWMEEVFNQYLPPIFRHQRSPARNTPTKTAEGMTSLMTEAGFEITRVVEEDFELLYEDNEEWLAVQHSHGVRFIFEIVQPPARDEMIAAANKHLDALKTAEGIPQRLTALITTARKPKSELI